MAIKLHPSFAVHPGEWLKTEIVEPHGLSVTVAAGQLGVTRQAMSNLLNGNAGLPPRWRSGSRKRSVLAPTPCADAGGA